MCFSKKGSNDFLFLNYLLELLGGISCMHVIHSNHSLLCLVSSSLSSQHLPQIPFPYSCVVVLFWDPVDLVREFCVTLGLEGSTGAIWTQQGLHRWWQWTPSFQSLSLLLNIRKIHGELEDQKHSDTMSFKFLIDYNTQDLFVNRDTNQDLDHSHITG